MNSECSDKEAEKHFSFLTESFGFSNCGLFSVNYFMWHGPQVWASVGIRKSSCTGLLWKILLHIFACALALYLTWVVLSVFLVWMLDGTVPKNDSCPSFAALQALLICLLLAWLKYLFVCFPFFFLRLSLSDAEEARHSLFSLTYIQCSRNQLSFICLMTEMSHA